MAKIVLHGDSHSHGGVVWSGANHSIEDGRLIVRQGDPAVCNTHGSQTVAQGTPKFKVEGQQAALDGMTLTCGATISATGKTQVN